MLVSLLISLLVASASAEYRAFQLEITNTATKTSRTVVSNLDDIQYPEYYPLQPGETIQYLDTWMCYGPTDWYTPVCPKPVPTVQKPSP